MLPAFAMADVVVIGHPGLGVDSVTAEEAANLFLGKAATLSNGAKVTVVDQKEGSAAREEFYSKVAGKDQSQLKAYWAKIVFTGKGTPPEALANDEAVKKRVASTPGTIGYINSGAADGSVHVLLKP